MESFGAAHPECKEWSDELRRLPARRQPCIARRPASPACPASSFAGRRDLRPRFPRQIRPARRLRRRDHRQAHAGRRVHQEAAVRLEAAGHRHRDRLRRDAARRRRLEKGRELAEPRQSRRTHRAGGDQGARHQAERPQKRAALSAIVRAGARFHRRQPYRRPRLAQRARLPRLRICARQGDRLGRERLSRTSATSARKCSTRSSIPARRNR